VYGFLSHTVHCILEHRRCLFPGRKAATCPPLALSNGVSPRSHCAGGLQSIFSGRQLTDRIAIPNYVPWRFQTLPFVVKLAVFVLLVDCSAYWLHRLWHTGWLWRIHKWHHAPTYMYWLAGVRASLPQILMAGLPFLIWLPLIKPVPPLFFMLYSPFLIITNNWMHMNVRWRSRWLEWILVTPRYHHIHHGNDPALYMRNYGVIFTFWDWLFGTYADPEQITQEIRFGVGEPASEIRLAIGI
jgi:sterol desaturase/sphingolipid hydroxylase (fatty acid hydroxylase superfamily)